MSQSLPLPLIHIPGLSDDMLVETEWDAFDTADPGNQRFAAFYFFATKAAAERRAQVMTRMCMEDDEFFVWTMLTMTDPDIAKPYAVARPFVRSDIGRVATVLDGNGNQVSVEA